MVVKPHHIYGTVDTHLIERKLQIHIVFCLTTSKCGIEDS